MNFISQKINFNRILFFTTVLTLASFFNGPLTKTALGQTTKEINKDREHCRRVVKPSAAANYNVYTRCLSDRGIYEKDSEWWEYQVNEHCKNVWRRNARERCYTDRGIQPPN